MPDAFYAQFLIDWRTIFPRLNPRAGFDTGNCPAVTAAVDRYLTTGTIHGAPGSMAGFGFEVPALTRAPLTRIVHSLTRSGDHVVVAADGGGRHHEFNLLRVGTTTYYVDAYTRPGVVATDVTARASWASTFEFGRGYSARLVPT